MKGFFTEFKAFITKGNIFDLAIGLIIGASFNAIVKSLVDDIIMPIFGLIIKHDIASLKVILVPEVLSESGEVVKKAVTLNYGNFIQNIINFLIISFSIFLAIKVMVKVKTKISTLEEIAKEKLLKKENNIEDK